MLDQAFQLRQAFQVPALAPRDRRPLVVTLTSGCSGANLTSLAVGLGRALIWQGRTTLLVDGDFEQPRLGERLGLAPRHTIQEVLSGRVSLHEAIERGPQGDLLLAGAWNRRGGDAVNPAAHLRLIDALIELGNHVDAVLIDAGHQRSPALERWTQASDWLGVATGSGPEDVLDTYAHLKWLHSALRPLPRTGLLVRAAETSAAVSAARRIAQACWRFQHWELESFDPILTADELEAGDGEGSPSAALLSAAVHLVTAAPDGEPVNPTQPSDPLQPIKSSSRVSST